LGDFKAYQLPIIVWPGKFGLWFAWKWCAEMLSMCVLRFYMPTLAFKIIGSTKGDFDHESAKLGEIQF